MADIRVTSVIETYQRRLNSKPYVPSTTFGRATLGTNGVANKLFLAFLFSDPDVGVQFLKDAGLMISSIMCCKFWSAYRDLEPYGYTHHASTSRSVSFMCAIGLIRARSRARGDIWRHSSIPATAWGFITWPTTCSLRGADPTTWTSLPSSSALLQLQRLNCPSSRSIRYVILRRPTPVQSLPTTRQFGDVHDTTLDMVPSFVVLCATHTTKIPNYSTTSERSLGQLYTHFDVLTSNVSILRVPSTEKVTSQRYDSQPIVAELPRPPAVLSSAPTLFSSNR